MIESQKKLTIKEAKNNMQHDINELELYLTKKRINFQKTQPQATNYDKIVVSGTPISFDKFTHYVIRDEDYDIKIYSLLESINAWEKYIIEEMKRMSQLDEGKFKVILLRQNENYIKEHGKPMEWNKIGELTNYSEKQCRRIYKEYIG